MQDRFISCVTTMLALLLTAQPGWADHADASEALVTRESAHSVSETLDRLEALVREKGFTVFARIDHAAGAERVGQSLRPTELLIFGNPKVGTALMSAAQTVGLDLPIRVVAYEDEGGAVHLAYTAPTALAHRHHITQRDEVIGRMTKALAGLTTAAAGAR